MSLVRTILNRPLPPRVGIVQAELDRFRDARYLEIGVHTGVLFLHVRASVKLGVDPHPRVPQWKRLLHPNTSLRGHLIRQTSDAFFEGLADKARFDVVFVDGLHLWEQCLRDIESSLEHLSEGGVVLVHDCNPADAVSAAREPTPGAEWCGDVWKTIAHLRANRADLDVETLDTDNGIGVVRRAAQPRPHVALDVAPLDYSDLFAARTELLGLRKP
jgi:hypothetical protein